MRLTQQIGNGTIPQAIRPTNRDTQSRVGTSAVELGKYYDQQHNCRETEAFC